MINYHAYDDSWVPDMLAGRTMEQAGKDKFDGDLLGTRPKDSFAAIVERACRAAERSTISTGSSTSRSATSWRGSTSGRSTRSGDCGPTTWPR